MATKWDDDRKGVDWLVVQANGLKIGADSRTTATVNRDELRLTPSKRDSFQSVARSVVETTVSLPSCQQARSTSWQCRRSLTKSVSDETSYFTGHTVSRDTAWNEGDPTECRLRRQSLAHSSPRVFSSMNHQSQSHELPRRADPDKSATAATAVVQCPVQADGLSLRGPPTPSPQRSRSRRGAGRHYCDGQMITTAHVRQQPLAQPRKLRAKELVL